MESHKTARPWVLIADDEPENLKALERTLRHEFELVLCSGPHEALEQLDKQEFEVVVSDQRMPMMMGTELLQKIAAEKPLVSRIILTAYTESKEMLDAINRAEIFRYITKPWDNEELVSALHQAVQHHRLRRDNLKLVAELRDKNTALLQKEQELMHLNSDLEKRIAQRTAELKAANEKLSDLAMTDPLTRIHNRRSFFQKLGDEIERSRRYKHTITLAMIDVDHFKSFNDMEGHVYGDEALRKIAQIFSGNIRKTDVVGRYGGEEFILMMPETKVKVGAEICERLRAGVEAMTFQGKDENAYLTISVGVIGFPEQGDTAEELVQEADRALYEAKETGRNRVVIG